MREQNVDIHPKTETLARFPGVDALTSNKNLNEVFDRYEKEAVSAKRLYQGLGRLSVTLIAISAAYSVARVTFQSAKAFEHSRINELLEGAALLFITCAALALALQLYLWLSQKKNAWLIARFAAERVRSIKFQAFPLAGAARDSAELAARADEYYRRQLDKLRNELNGEMGALRAFRPERALDPAEGTAQPTSKPLYEAARDAFHELRLYYQKNFAEAEVASLESRELPLRITGDHVFMLGATLVFLTTLILALYPKESELAPWLELGTVVAFIVSAAVGIIEHASIAKVSIERYRDYARNLDALSTKVGSLNVGLAAEVEATEDLALRELQEFCTAAQLISFRI